MQNRPMPGHVEWFDMGAAVPPMEQACHLSQGGKTSLLSKHSCQFWLCFDEVIRPKLRYTFLMVGETYGFRTVVGNAAHQAWARHKAGTFERVFGQVFQWPSMYDLRY